MPIVVAHNVRRSMINASVVDRDAVELDQERMEYERRQRRNMRSASLDSVEEVGSSGSGSSSPTRLAKKASFGLRKSLAKFLKGSGDAAITKPDHARAIFEDRIFLPNSNHKLAWDIFLCALIVYSVITVTTRLGFDLEVGLRGNE